MNTRNTLKNIVGASLRRKAKSVRQFFHVGGPMLFFFVFAIENPHCGSSYDHRLLAQFYLQKNEYGQALLEAKRAIRMQPNELGPYLIAILAHLGRNEAEGAFNTLRDALDHGLDPRDSHLYGTLRQFAVEAGRIDLAQQIFTDLLQQHPDNDLIRSNLGWTYLEQGQLNKALTLFQAVEDPEVLSYAKLNIGQIYAQQGNLSAATQVLHEALEVDPGNSSLWMESGEVYLRQDDFMRADEHFHEAINQHRNPTVLALQIGSVYYSRSLRTQAIKYWELALEQGQPNASLLNNLAWAYAEEQIELDRALALSLMAVKTEPESSIFLDTYAELFYLKGRYDRAIAVIKRALTLEPQESEHYSYLQDQLNKFRQAQTDSIHVPL